MRWTIATRLFAAFIITSLIIVGLNAFATRWSFEQGFVAYLRAQEDLHIAAVVEELADIYATNGDWEILQDNQRRWGDLFRPQREKKRDPERRRPGPRGRPPPVDLSDLAARSMLADLDGSVILGRDLSGPNAQMFDVRVDGIAVAVLHVMPRKSITQAVDVEFARKQGKTIWLIGIGVLLLAAMVAAVLARQLVRPITTLTNATNALAQGDYGQNITVTRDDEIGDLARDFNHLAKTLQSNRAARRQWVSDISHELRTPLAILSGELQAIEDGVRQFDDGTRASLQAEVQRLGKLVADLHQLTLSDEGGMQYRFAPLNVARLIDDIIEPQRQRIEERGLALCIEHADDNTSINADEMRFEQLLSNLIENCLRYTDAPGELRVNTLVDGTTAQIVIEDSSPGVSRNELSQLFDRLYRVDPSRNRGTGGSGLGLSIAAAIVSGHHGEVMAEPSQLGGVAIRMRFPIAGTRTDS